MWSFILSAWSDVLETMVSQNFIEGVRGEVVIRDFSARAVRAFLHFLYAGVLEEDSLFAVVEVAAIADKYGVSKLRYLCEDHVVKSLSPEEACEFLELADRYNLHDLRQSCFDHILVRPLKALKTRPSIGPALLQEVFSSSLLCMNNLELLELFISWGIDSASSGLGSVVPLIEQHVHVSQILRSDAERLSEKVRALQDPAGERVIAMLSQVDNTVHADDVLSSLWRSFCSESGAGSNDADGFVGYRVNVGVSRRGLIQPRGLAGVACGRLEGRLRPGDWIAWNLPNDEVFLSGLSFVANIGPEDHVLVYTAAESSGWTLVLDTKCHGSIPYRTVISCRCERAVQRFKLQVVATRKEGVRLGRLQLHGVLIQTATAATHRGLTAPSPSESEEEDEELDFDLFGAQHPAHAAPSSEDERDFDLFA